jgi:hypothetical protein
MIFTCKMFMTRFIPAMQSDSAALFIGAGSQPFPFLISPQSHSLKIGYLQPPRDAH